MTGVSDDEAVDSTPEKNTLELPLEQMRPHLFSAGPLLTDDEILNRTSQGEAPQTRPDPTEDIPPTIPFQVSLSLRSVWTSFRNPLVKGDIRLRLPHLKAGYAMGPGLQPLISPPALILPPDTVSCFPEAMAPKVADCKWQPRVGATRCRRCRTDAKQWSGSTRTALGLLKFVFAGEACERIKINCIRVNVASSSLSLQGYVWLEWAERPPPRKQRLVEVDVDCGEAGFDCPLPRRLPRWLHPRQ